MNFKRSSQIGLLILILIFTKKFFKSTPFETLFFQIQAGFLGLILIFLFFYIANILVEKKSIKKEVFYFLMLILFMPLYSAYRSHSEFGQPYIYGILSQRSWLLLGVGIWFYYVISIKKVAISTIEYSFLLMAWASLIIFSLFALTFDPSQLTGEENFAHMTPDRGLRFKFQTFFITFGAIYYFVKYNVDKKKSDLLALLLFLTYVVFIIQGRTYMIFLASLFLVYYYLNNRLSVFAVKIINVLLFFVSVIVIIQIIYPEYIEVMSNLFMQMFIVLGGEESNSASSNARLWTSAIIFDYFDAHPSSLWFGTGKISNQWNDGYERLFGYFYPSDVGILGGLFLHGFFGMVFLMIIPLILTIKEIKKAKVVDNSFIITIKYLLMLSILRLPQGGLYFGGSMMLYFILYSYNRLERKKYAK